MTTLFIVCAAIGGTILVFQFVLTLIGLGGEALDVDLPGDVDFDADADFDFDSGVGAGHVDSSWLFGVISFRTVVAALAFFGLGGLAAQSAELSDFYSLLVAVAAGAVAMYAVYWMMRGLKKLRSEGNVRIQGAVGKHGTVYTTIPGEEAGTGKIQLNLQNRTVELLALTAGHELAPGAKVVVTDIVTLDTVQVQPVLEPEGNNHA